MDVLLSQRKAKEVCSKKYLQIVLASWNVRPIFALPYGNGGGVKRALCEDVGAGSLNGFPGFEKSFENNLAEWKKVSTFALPYGKSGNA